jgi:hypothetical protein
LSEGAILSKGAILWVMPNAHVSPISPGPRFFPSTGKSLLLRETASLLSFRTIVEVEQAAATIERAVTVKKRVFRHFPMTSTRCSMTAT